MSQICPFCKQDPFHYVDVGIGMVPVAVNCCDSGIALYSGNKQVIRALRLRQSHSPRRKARAARMLAQLSS